MHRLDPDCQKTDSSANLGVSPSLQKNLKTFKVHWGLNSPKTKSIICLSTGNASSSSSVIGLFWQQYEQQLCVGQSRDLQKASLQRVGAVPGPAAMVERWLRAVVDLLAERRSGNGGGGWEYGC